jgi:hypothetical protein
MTNAELHVVHIYADMSPPPHFDEALSRRREDLDAHSHCAVGFRLQVQVFLAEACRLHSPQSRSFRMTAVERSPGRCHPGLMVE